LFTSLTIVPEDVPEMSTLFHVSGAYVYVHPQGKPTAIEDVFTKLAKAKTHYKNVGLGEDYATRFIR